MHEDGCRCAAALAVGAGASAGCGGDDEPRGRGRERRRTKPVRVAVIMASLGNDFYIAQKDGRRGGGRRSMPGADVTVSAGPRAGLDGRGRRPDRERDRQGRRRDRGQRLGHQAAAPGAAAGDRRGHPARAVRRAGGRAEGPARGLHRHRQPRRAARPAASGSRQKLPEGGKVGVVLCVAGHPVTTRAARRASRRAAGDGLQGRRRRPTRAATAEKGRKAMEDMLTAPSASSTPCSRPATASRSARRRR